MSRSISIRELQKMSAGTLRALSGPVPIKSGHETVALLTPFRRPDPERLSAILKRIDDHYAELSPEVQRELQILVGEIEDR